MQIVKRLLILGIIIYLFIIFRPQIMHWVYIMKNEFSPIGSAANASYREFKQHDIYKKEKAIDRTLNEMSNGSK